MVLILPTVPGTIIVPITAPVIKELRPNLSIRILAMKEAIPAPNNEPEVIAKVLKINTGAFNN